MLQTLGLIPERIHLGKGHVLDAQSLLLGLLLHIIESADELLVGVFQGIIGVDVIETACVDQREQEIAILLVLPLLVALFPQLRLQLVQFLLHLVPDVLWLVPVKAHVTGLFLNTVSLDQGGQGIRHASEDGLVAILFGLLDLLPTLEYLTRRIGDSIPIDMRMTVYQLVAQLVANVGNIEVTLLASYLGIKDHMQEHVTQLLADVLVVVLEQSVTQLKRLLYRVGTQAFVGLFAVPRTFLPQVVHHIQQTTECLQFFFFCMHKRKIHLTKVQRNLQFPLAE